MEIINAEIKIDYLMYECLCVICTALKLLAFVAQLLLRIGS